jgi:hypothetical protein
MGTELAIVKPLRFFTYDQNNSGGSFRVDEYVAHTVIIEAVDAEAADSKARDIGIYFNGCDKGYDCECCGDRWYPAYGEGDESPNIYGEDPEVYGEKFAKTGEPYCHVYYADGIVKTYRK